MAKIVDVTDVPEYPGAGLLHFDDGRPPLMALPEIADEHRERLGIEGDQRLAMTPQQATGGRPPERLDAGGGIFGRVPPWGGTLGPPPGAAPLPSALPAPAAPPPVAPPQPAPTESAGPPPPPVGAPPSSIAAPPTTQDLSTQAVDAAKQHVAEDLLYGKVVPGSAGRSGGYQPTLQKVTTEAGPQYDPRAAGERIDAGSAVLDAQLAELNAKKQIADATAARAAAENAAAMHSAAHQQAEMQRKQLAYQQQNRGLENELTQYTQEATPDPNRFFSDRGVVATIFSAIGQGLGAFGASLNHTQNYAFDAVQSAIKANISAQQQQYEAGRADRTNALARLANYYHGDIDMAKQALTIAMNKVAQTETEKFAAQAQSKDISAAAPVLAAQFQQQQLLAEQAKHDLAMGKTTVVNEDKYQAPQGASVAHRDPNKMTDAERETAAKFLVGKPEKDQGALGLSPQALARQKAAYGLKIENTERYTDTLAHEAQLMGVKLDPETGTIVDPKTGKPATEVHVPLGAGYIGQHLPGAIKSMNPEATALHRARVNSARLHATAILDKSITAEEGEKEAENTLGQTDKERLDSLRVRAHELWASRRAFDATAASIDPRMVNERNQAERDVAYSRATGAPLPGPRAQPSGSVQDEPESDGGGP